MDHYIFFITRYHPQTKQIIKHNTLTSERTCVQIIHVGVNLHLLTCLCCMLVYTHSRVCVNEREIDR